MRDVSLRRTGRYVQAHFGKDAGAHTIAALAAAGKLLPTFVDAGGRLSAATGRVFVRAPSTAARSEAAAVSARRSGSPVAALSGGDIYTFTHADPWEAVDAVTELRAAGIAAELDHVREHKLHYVPNDPLFPSQWHLLNGGQGVSTAGVDTRVSEAWDITLGDPQVIIAINDDGVDLNHADFAGRLEPQLNYPLYWEQLIIEGNFGGHGTSVAGVAAAGVDDLVGGAGACPECRILPHMLAQTGPGGSFELTDFEAAAGFRRQVDAGAWIISNSWGTPLGDAIHAEEEAPQPDTPMVINDAFQYAEDTGRGGLGTVIVFAAGNENTKVDHYNKHPLVVSVAAVGDLGLKAYYSCFGPEISIATPSSGALTGITTTSLSGQTENFGGTSSAAPLAAGILGLIFSANPSLTAAEARQVLKDSATPIDPVFGNYNAGRSPYYGAGMANAYVAVNLANGSCNDPANCQAPSDACGVQCGTQQACGPCRTQADCATGHVCQSLASLGRTVCVAEKGAGACPAGTNERNGHCVPTAETCGACVGSEECNGRDDDCNGEADEGTACSGSPVCFIDSPACADGTVCAAITCRTACSNDDDCGSSEQCRTIKDPYGAVTGAKACLSASGGGCAFRCSTRASSTDDATLAAFVACAEMQAMSCSDPFSCYQLLSSGD
jgi:subtilisin family serine protease